VTIQAGLPVLSGLDDKRSDKGSSEDSDEDDGLLDGDAPYNDDGDNDPGFNFLPNEEEDDNNDDSRDNGSLLPPLS
jgi:hypothetical protein